MKDWRADLPRLAFWLCLLAWAAGYLSGACVWAALAWLVTRLALEAIAADAAHEERRRRAGL